MDVGDVPRCAEAEKPPLASHRAGNEPVARADVHAAARATAHERLLYPLSPLVDVHQLLCGGRVTATTAGAGATVAAPASGVAHAAARAAAHATCLRLDGRRVGIIVALLCKV